MSEQRRRHVIVVGRRTTNPTSLIERIGRRLEDVESEALRTCCPLLGDGARYAGLVSRTLTDESALTNAHWASWALDGSEPCLLVQTTALHAISVDNVAYELNGAPYAFQQHVALQGELVLIDGRVHCFVTELLWHQAARPSNERQVRMSHARALIDSSLVRNIVDFSTHGPQRVLAAIAYKPHMTALLAEAVVHACPPLLSHCRIVGMELRHSNEPHLSGSASVLVLALPNERIGNVLRALASQQVQRTDLGQ